MSRIFLHIGHGKTGTSFIQSYLAKNVSALERYGILYPIGKEGQKAAAANETTSGNQALLASWLERNVGGFETDKDLLFSGETLFKRLGEPQFLNRLLDAAKKNNKQIELLFFIRDPADYQVSGYLQRVQQGMCGKDIEEYFAEDAPKDQKRVFGGVSDVIALSANNNIPLKIINYSREKRNIIYHLRNFLRIPDDFVLEVPDRLVNRSLSAIEVGAQLAILEALRDYEGTTGKNHLKYFVDTTVGISGTPPSVSDGALAAFFATVREDTAVMNKSLPETQAYLLENVLPSKKDGWNQEQAYGRKLAVAIIQATLNIISSNINDREHDSNAVAKMRSVIVTRLKPGLADRRSQAMDLLNTNLHEAALPLLQELATETENPQDQHRLAKCFFALDDQESAEKYAQLCFRSRPEVLANTLLLFNILAERSAKTEIEELLVRFKNVENSEHLYQFLTGRYAFVEGRLSDAATAFRQASALEPKNKSYEAWLRRVSK